MSHIDNITRATKAYHILAQATNVHLSLSEMIHRLELGLGTGQNTIAAATKALTGQYYRSARRGFLIRNFFHSLQITGNSYEEKIDALNEFGNDIYLADREQQEHDNLDFGLNDDSPSLHDIGFGWGYRS